MASGSALDNQQAADGGAVGATTSAFESSVAPENQERARTALSRGRKAVGTEVQAADQTFGPDSKVQKSMDTAEESAGEAKGIMGAAEDQIAGAIGDHKKAEKEYKDALGANLENRMKITEQMNVMDELSKQIAAGQVHDVWGDANIGVKIGAIIATGLGAAAQSYSGAHNNAAADLINQHIQRAMMIQRMRLEKNKDDYAMRNTLMGRLMQNSDHIEDAAQKAFATAHQGIMGRIEALKALTTNAQTRASLDNLSAGLQLHAAQAYMQVVENTVGQQVGLSEHEASTEAAMGRTHSSAMDALRIAKEARLQHAQNVKEANREEDRKLLGYHPIKGNDMAGPIGETKSVTAVRDAIAAHASADTALGDLYKSISDRTKSIDDWNTVKQNLAKVTLTLKGGKQLNMGANFTDMERSLIEQGVLGTKNGTLQVLNPGGVKKAIANFASFWRKNLADQAATIGMEKD